MTPLARLQLVAIDCPDAHALARFYSALTGWPIDGDGPDEDWIELVSPGGPTIAFQRVSGYQPPVWPPVEGAQRPMAHLDFQVADLDAAVADAIALGATLAPEQRLEPVRVMFDPAGHPFCLCLTSDGAGEDGGGDR